MQWFDAIILCRQRRYHFTCSIRAAVVHRNYFVNVFSIEIQNSLNQWPDIHLFVVGWNHYRDSSAKGFMSEKRNLRQLFPTWRFLRVNQNGTGQPA